MTERYIPEYARETIDFIPFENLKVDGLPPDPQAVHYSIVPERGRPTEWEPADMVDGRIGFVLNGPSLGKGVFKVFGRLDVIPGPPVFELGSFRLT